MLEEDVPGKAAKTGVYLKGKLKALAAEKNAILDVRGQGLLLGVQLDEKHPTGAAVGALLTKGFVTGTAAGNVLRLLPPLIITEADCDGLVAALADIL